jgi:hypothetical protein
MVRWYEEEVGDSGERGGTDPERRQRTREELRLDVGGGEM